MATLTQTQIEALLTVTTDEATKQALQTVLDGLKRNGKDAARLLGGNSATVEAPWRDSIPFTFARAATVAYKSQMPVNTGQSVDLSVLMSVCAYTAQKADNVTTEVNGIHVITSWRQKAQSFNGFIEGYLQGIYVPTESVTLDLLVSFYQKCQALIHKTGSRERALFRALALAWLADMVGVDGIAARVAYEHEAGNGIAINTVDPTMKHEPANEETVTTIKTIVSPAKSGKAAK